MDENNIVQYRRHLVEEEKSAATVQKYLHDIRVFFEYIGTQPISKENTIAYKEYLCEKLAAVSVNSMLAALNHYLRFLGRLRRGEGAHSDGIPTPASSGKKPKKSAPVVGHTNDLRNRHPR